MNSKNWWHLFLRHSRIFGNLKKIPLTTKDKFNTTSQLFNLLKQGREAMLQISKQDLNTWIHKADLFRNEMRIQGENTKDENSRTFYLDYSQIIAFGLVELKSTLQGQSTSHSTPSTIRGEKSLPSGGGTVTEPVDKTSATAIGKLLTTYRHDYISAMEALHQTKEAKGLKKTDADEADRLESFISVALHWLKHQHALEYSKKILTKNRDDSRIFIDKEPLPLLFRLEQNTPTLTFRLIRSTLKKPTSDDVSIFDIINECYSIPVNHKNGQLLVDDTDVIRFVRLHSKENQLLVFKDDPLSGIALKMYNLLVCSIKKIKGLIKEIIELINKTPMNNLDLAFSGINPDECRELIKRKFRALLPGINEDRYRAEKKNGPRRRSTRTIEIMEDYNRAFEKSKEETLTDTKATLAMVYWLRKLLTSIIRNNQARRKKEAGGEKKKKRKTAMKTVEDFDNWLLVGTSVTIGDDDISNFYISPDDIISSQMSLQRADRADKWIAVRKSENTHRIHKKDFFYVIQKFLEEDLNPLLRTFGFSEIDLYDQLLPEIKERLDDVGRVDLIRSGILGTTITNVEDFEKNKKFHLTLKRYFQKPTYNNVHYPEREKMALVSGGLSHSNTSILQMKYRKVLKVCEEMEKKMNSLKASTRMGVTKANAIDGEEEYREVKRLRNIILKVRQIMLDAKPSLRDISLEPSEDYIVIKASSAYDTFTNLKK